MIKHGKNDKTRKKRKVSNSSKSEIEGLESLTKRVKEGEITISMTDKSGRMAVVTRKQYLECGYMHTMKDKTMSWKDIKYLQSQINNHTWWFSSIVGNAKDCDQTRMFKNIHDASAQLPEMYLLLKDHKAWSKNDGTPIPSTPVHSGNCCINTHLSELVAEVIEPIATRLNGA